MKFRHFLVVLLLGAIAAGAVVIPAGTELHVRLLSKVGSNTSRAGQPVEAVVIQPAVSNGTIVVAAGTRLTGTVKELQPHDKTNERAHLLLEFTELVGADGRKAGVQTKVAAVDNAREYVDEAGRIIGILASETLSARMNQGIEKLGGRYAVLADILGAAKSAVLRDTDPAIEYEPGVEMVVKLTGPVQWSNTEPPPRIDEIPNHDALIRLAASQPFRTTTQADGKPSDITNLMFIGSQQELERAFKAAGWSTAAALDQASAMETFRAIAEMRGYKEAPMSILLLEGRRSDLDFQKQNNTFAMRHHLRIWRRPVSFEGKQVWVCAATHDIGIEFSAENSTFIHKIDPNIDKERSKVVNDLFFAGHVKGLALVARPGVPTETVNGTGDKLITDGSMAVVLLGGS